MVRTAWSWPGLAVFFALAVAVAIAKKDLPAGSAHAASPDPPAAAAYRSKDAHAEPVIEEVTAKQLERVLNEKDYVAVFWCE